MPTLHDPFSTMLSQRLFVAAAIVLLSGSTACADTTARQPLQPPEAPGAEMLRPLVDRESPDLVKLYQEFHANPELSLQEKETARKIEGVRTVLGASLPRLCRTRDVR